MKKIVLFASGNGTNAENIIKYFKEKKDVIIQEIFTNNPNAGVIQRAKNLNVPVSTFNKESFYNKDEVLTRLKQIDPDLIVLAGFLWKVPVKIIESFNNRIVNIHPALLPNYGGKGMYGMHVHKAVINSGDRKSGISIHWVNEEYDKGDIIAQFTCPVSENDTPESLAQKVHQLEYTHFPLVIDNILGNKYKV